MKNNWTKAVNEINRKRYIIPEGWETRDQVAESLQCEPSKVAEILKPGILAGEFERAEFSVWNDKRRLTERVTCYRIVGEGQTPAAPSRKASPAASRTISREERIRAAILRNPNASPHAIASKLYKVRTSEVRDMMSKM